MKPKTILAILALKLYIGHKRLETKISTKIKINEQMQFLQNGYNSHLIETPNDIKIAKRTWSDEISSVMSSRSIKFDNNDFEECQITQNKIIMSYAVEYVKENNLKNEILAPIN